MGRWPRTGPLFLGVALAGPAAGADGPGTSAFHFLNLGAGPRIEALGEVGTTLAEGIDALVWNPALLATTRNREAGASYFRWLDGVGVGSAGAVAPAGRGAAGLSVRSLTVSDFGNVPGETDVGQSDVAVAAAGAYPVLGTLDAGLALKLVRSSLAGRDATGWAGDFGLNYRYVEGWNIAAAVRNFGAAFGYVDGVDESLPTQTAFGIGATLGELRVGTEVLWENGPGWVGAVGAEYRLWDRLAFRFGGRLGEDADRATEPWAVGVGVWARPGLEFDYAFRDGVFDASHRVGVRWTLDRPPGGRGEKLARSPREFYVDVLQQVLDRSLASFPMDVTKVAVRSAAPHDAESVISEVLAARLRDRGVEVEVWKPEPELPGDLAPEQKELLAEQGIGGEPDRAVLEYEVRTSEYSILRSRRARWIGPRSLDRRARIDLAFALSDPGVEAPVWTSSAEGSETETVAASRIPSSSGYPRASGRAAGKARKLHPLVEPAIVGGIVAGLAVIFFSNRDVGQ